MSDAADRGDAETRLIAGSGLFDASFYFVEGPDVHEAGADALDHFRAYGWREGHRPNLYFDPAWYREIYFPADDTERNPLVHYIREGEAAGCRPIAYFDPGWYRRTYGLPVGHGALAHYLAEWRKPRYTTSSSSSVGDPTKPPHHEGGWEKHVDSLSVVYR